MAEMEAAPRIMAKTIAARKLCIGYPAKPTNSVLLNKMRLASSEYGFMTLSQILLKWLCDAPVMMRHRAAPKSATNGMRALRQNMEITRNTMPIVHTPTALTAAERMEYCHKSQFIAAVLKLLTAYSGRLPPSADPKEHVKPI